MRGRGKKQHRLHNASKRVVSKPFKATDSVEEVIENWQDAFAKGAFEFNQFIKEQRALQKEPHQHLNIIDIKLKGLSLANYDLCKVVFRDCDLDECHFGDSKADEFYFINTKLRQCDVQDIKWQDVGHKPTGLYFLKSQVRDSTISTGNLKIDSFTLNDTVIRESELNDIAISRLNWQNTEIDYSIINGLEMDHPQMEECLFTDVEWKGLYTVLNVGSGRNNTFERCDFRELWQANKGRQAQNLYKQTNEAFTGQRGFGSFHSIWRACKLPEASLDSFIPINPPKRNVFQKPYPNGITSQYKEMTNNEWFNELGEIVATKPRF